MAELRYCMTKMCAVATLGDNQRSRPTVTSSIATSVICHCQFRVTSHSLVMRDGWAFWSSQAVCSVTVTQPSVVVTSTIRSRSKLVLSSRLSQSNINSALPDNRSSSAEPGQRTYCYRYLDVARCMSHHALQISAEQLH